MPYHRRRGVTKNKQMLKHSGTLVVTHGPGTTILPRIQIADTEVGQRDPAGPETNVQANRTTGNECNIGDCIKYINILIQTGPTAQNNVSQGWLEYAVVTKLQATLDVTNVNLGTQTLGDTCTQYFRNECIWTGFVPVGSTMTNGVALQIKVPKAKQFLRMGDEIIMYVHFRSTVATDVSTTSNRAILSFNYKSYA